MKKSLNLFANSAPQRKQTFYLSMGSVLVLLLFSLCLSGCDGAPSAAEGDLANDVDWDATTFTVSEPQVPVSLNDNLKITDELLNENSNSIVITPDSSLNNANLMAGNILVSTAGEGALRRVISVNKDGANLVLNVEPATLEEAIADGDWKHEIPAASEAELEAAPLLSPDQSVIIRPDLPQLNTYAASVEVKDKKLIFKYDLSGKTLYSEKTAVGNLTLSITEGAITFTPTLSMGGKHQNKKFYEYTITTNGQLNVNLKVRAQIAKGYSKSIDKKLIPAATKPFAFTIGALPVVGTVTFNLYGGFNVNGSAQAALKTGLNCAMNLTVGAKYQNKNWSHMWNPTMECSADPVTAEANVTAGARIYLRPELGVKLYGVVGPTVDVEPFLSGTTYFQPKPLQCDYKVTTGISGNLNIEAKALGIEIAHWSKSLFSYEKKLRTGSFCQK